METLQIHKILQKIKVKSTLFIISGPSGVGKGTLRERVLEDIKDLVFSVSITTRERRPGEVDGKDYIFVSEEKFMEMIKRGEFLEWAKVYGYYYGTPKRFIEESLKNGYDVLLEIDIQGAKRVRERYPDVVSIFIIPPSLDEVVKRLKKRATEREEDFLIRVNKAKDEIKEIEHYDYFIINDDIEKASSLLKCIIVSHRSKVVKGGKNSEIKIS